MPNAWLDEQKEKCYITVHPAKLTRVAVYVKSEGVIRFHTLLAQKYFYPLRKLIYSLRVKYHISVYVEYYKPEVTKKMNIKLINRLPGQVEKRTIDLLHPDEGIRNQWSIQIDYSTTKSRLIHKTLKKMQCAYWVIGRVMWQRWHGVEELMHTPGMTRHEMDVVMRETIKRHWPKQKFVPSYHVPLMMLLYVLDRQEVYFRFDHRPQRYF